MPRQSDPTAWFVLACEDGGHFDAVTKLVDRVLESKIDWFVPELRGWRARNGYPWWPLKNAWRDARAARLPLYGQFDGEPAAPEAGMVRAQLLLWQRAGERIEAGFIARDTDRTAAAIDGARQAIRASRWPFVVVLAYPHPEVEAWHIVGFEPATEHEHARVDGVTGRLGFSPIRHPEKLTSKALTERDAKRVLEELVDGDSDRKTQCLEAPLEVLRSRGASCGLVAFLDAVEQDIVPLFTGTRALGS